MIDMHLHLLPGVDDGSRDIEESAAMLATLSGMGFDRLILTPHLMEPLSTEYYQSVLNAMNTVAPVAAAHNVALALGFEHLLSPSLGHRLREGEPTTLAGSHAVLVELPFMHWPADTAHNLFTLRDGGYRPVLAHPERYQDAIRNPQLLLDAIEHGVVPQITTGSIAGLYGADSQRLSRYVMTSCLGGDKPFVLSSDAHSNGRRLTSVADGLGWIRDNLELGEHIVTWATDIVPTQLVTDQAPVSFRTWLAVAHPSIPVPSIESYLALADSEQQHSNRGGRIRRLFRGRRDDTYGK